MPNWVILFDSLSTIDGFSAVFGGSTWLDGKIIGLRMITAVFVAAELYFGNGNSAHGGPQCSRNPSLPPSCGYNVVVSFISVTIVINVSLSMYWSS